MKKSIFLSVLALAAVVSCQKSEIVDSKYGNDEISIESYIGKSAQTKAAETTKANLTEASLYGYYTGEYDWSGSKNANLWNPITLSLTNGVVAEFKETDKRYWTNAKDKYTFLAYAPVAAGKLSVSGDETNGPTLSYVVDSALENQIDVLYATPVKNTTKEKVGESGSVALQFNHALARVTVNAKAESGQFKFFVKDITLSGAFHTAGSFVLGYDLTTAPAWTPTATATASAPEKYNFYTNNTPAKDNQTLALGAEYTKYAEHKKTASGAANNYLMMLPTTATATLTVKYTTYYMEQESNELEKTFTIEGGFAMGKAYAFNLDFAQTGTEIKFSADVTPWDEQSATKFDVK